MVKFDAPAKNYSVVHHLLVDLFLRKSESSSCLPKMSCEWEFKSGQKHSFVGQCDGDQPSCMARGEAIN